MEPKNYSTIRSILKKEQGEKIAPYIFKLTEIKTFIPVTIEHLIAEHIQCCFI